MEGQREITAVLAHSMLGSIAAVKGAIDTVLARDLDAATRDDLLRMALRRLQFLTEDVRNMAMGLPNEVIHLLDDIRRETSDPSTADHAEDRLN